MNAIETKSLVKEYGKIKAVDNISFNVEEGEIFGFLGPNGAGKSTTMMILTTLLKPTSGEAIVAGYDVVRQAKKVRENIGYVQQEIAVDEYLTGRENLLLEGRLNHIQKNLIEKRIDEVLELIELVDKQNEPVITYSGGMRKRLDIAGGLLHRPKVLILDEPTVGLDIQTRRKIWDYIRQIHKEFNMTIFVSTHYMEEADKLCDRVGIIDYGKIQAIDSPQAMKNALGNEVVSFRFENGVANQLVSQLKTIPIVKDVSINDDQIIVYTSKGTELIPQIFQISLNLQLKINEISLTQPTLDDVFISYTGHELRDENGKYNQKLEFAKMRRIRS
ncbi:MAG TPA: ATP-binding cassette domain-containing protein [Nitrosopumilaceae archaeon]|nr:ATP-binding cassette domain-containing protein [Nitrosopumilaceae archaeon]